MTGANSATPRRLGPWLQTASGRKFWPLDPEPLQVVIEDVAHALANTCRFGGATSEYYSVAQHSVYVSQLCESLAPEGMDANDAALHGLLHDAAEAYMGDLRANLKPWLRICPPWFGYGKRLEDFEAVLLDAIYEGLGLGKPTADMQALVHRADLLQRTAEVRELLGKPQNNDNWDDWAADWKPWLLPEDPDVPGEVIIGWTPPRARDWFVGRYHDLRAAGNAAGTPARKRGAP